MRYVNRLFSYFLLTRI